MKITPATKIKIGKRVVFREVEGLVYILDPRNATIHTLNQTASFIWLRLKAGQTIGELTQAVMENFKVEEKKAKADIKDFVSEYLEEGFLAQA